MTTEKQCYKVVCTATLGTRNIYVIAEDFSKAEEIALQKIQVHNRDLHLSGIEQIVLLGKGFHE